MKLGMTLVAALTATVLSAGAANAALVTVVEIDLTASGSDVAARDFAINGGPDQLRATAYSMNGGTPAANPTLTLNGAWGLGVRNGSNDGSHSVDNSGWHDYVGFTIPTRPGFEFTLVGVELGYIDWDQDTDFVCGGRIFGFCYDWDLVTTYSPGNDDFALWIDSGVPNPLSETPEPVLEQDIVNGTTCGRSSSPSGGNYTCRIGLAEGLAAYVADNGLEAFDYYLDLDPADLFGSEFFIGGTFGGSNDDFKITKIYWEVSETETVPEPATLGLLAFGLIAMGAARRRAARG